MDNEAETRTGWGFVEDARNEEAFGGVDGKSACARYGEAIKSFRWQLLVLMHTNMSGGQAARGTELVTVQHKNGRTGRSCSSRCKARRWG